MKKMFSMLFVALAAIALVACGGGGDSGGGGAITGDVASITVVSSKATGDFTPSITPSVGDGGTIQFTIGALDIDSDGTVESPVIGSVKATTGDTMLSLPEKALSDTTITCEERDVGGTSSDKFDIGFCLDTTGSMGGAAGIIADKIADFAESLSASGVDARYAGVTVGDAFATKKTDASLYPAAAISLDIDDNTLGTLLTSDTLPTFDTSERPDTGTTLLTSANLSNYFDLIKEVVGSGSGGGDGPENYLGCVEFLFDEIAWRSDSTKIIISVSDNCAHTDETYDSSSIYGGPITEPWIPSAGSALVSKLAGNATVHVVGGNWTGETIDDVPSIGTCSAGYYDPKGLADGTGGVFSTFVYGSCSSEDTCDVDLTKLPIESAITEGKVDVCDGKIETYSGTAGAEITITFTIVTSATGSTSGTEYTSTTTLVLKITFE